MTIQELNNYLIKKLEANRNEDEAFSDYLNELLIDYQEQIVKIDFDSFSVQQKRIIVDIVKIWCDGIMNSLKAFEEANIVKAIVTMQQLLNLYADKMNKFVINKNSNNIWYRMRNLEPYVRRYYAKDMFHVPFDKIGKLGNQRFSISGYPCLYLGNSVWSCWEEMHEPDMNNACVSRLEAIGEFCLLDLSWPRIITEDGFLSYKKQICTWPLVIACSIRALNPQDSFKPEYIIPQLVMIAIKSSNVYQGCAYTSTQRNDYFCWGYDRLLNVAIPVVKIHKKGLCSELTSKFKITDSTKGEYIRLEGEISPFNFDGTCAKVTSNGKYEASVFGNIESEFNRKSELKSYIITI